MSEVTKMNKTRKMMKNVKMYGLGLLALAALMVSACQDDTSVNPEGLTPIRLQSSVLQLKSGLQNVQIANGQQLGFFVNKDAESTFSTENFLLTADGDGAFTHSPLYYPIGGSSFIFTAYHPRQASVTDGEVEFSVLSAQDIDANYLNSDLLYVKKADIVRTTSAVALEFKHLLSRLTFTIKKGEDTEIHELSEILVSNVLPNVTLNLLDGSLSEASGTLSSITANGVTGGESGVESLSGGAAIVVPQIIPTNTALLQITVGELSYTYTLSSALELKSGKSYAFEITVNKVGISVSSSIAEWEDGESVVGDGIVA